MKTIQTIDEISHDYKASVLTTLIIPIGFFSGLIAHKKFNPLFEQSEASDNLILPARYIVGYVSTLPVYLLIACLQKQHHDNIPLWRRLSDFIVSGFLVGCGVMFGRLFGK